MGGQSQGRAEVVGDAIRLSGIVSTANRGGFIQVRTDLQTPPPQESAGVALQVRGNGERYFVHLRTRGTLLPWQYYQSGFAAAPAWRFIRLPWASFNASSRVLRRMPRPQDLVSVGLVAFGRAHVAELEVRALSFYS